MFLGTRNQALVTVKNQNVDAATNIVVVIFGSTGALSTRLTAAQNLLFVLSILASYSPW